VAPISKTDVAVAAGFTVTFTVASQTFLWWGWPYLASEPHPWFPWVAVAATALLLTPPIWRRLWIPRAYPPGAGTGAGAGAVIGLAIQMVPMLIWLVVIAARRAMTHQPPQSDAPEFMVKLLMIPAPFASTALGTLVGAIAGAVAARSRVQQN